MLRFTFKTALWGCLYTASTSNIIYIIGTIIGLFLLSASEGSQSEMLLFLMLVVPLLILDSLLYGFMIFFLCSLALRGSRPFKMAPPFSYAVLGSVLSLLISLSFSFKIFPATMGGAIADKGISNEILLLIVLTFGIAGWLVGRKVVADQIK